MKGGTSISGWVAGSMMFLSLSVIRVALLRHRRAGVIVRLNLPPRQSVSRSKPRWSAPGWIQPRLAEAGWAGGGAGAAGAGAAEAGAADRAWRAWLTLTACVVIAALSTAGVGLAIVAAAAMAAAPVVVWWTLRHRSQAALDAALPTALEAVARGLRSGASLRQAVAEAAGETTGPLSDDLARVAADVAEGTDLVHALDAWAERRPLPGVRLTVAALCLGAETGGPRAQAVDGVAATLRQRLAAQAEAHALATQARLSGWVIAVAPIAFCALAAATDPRSAGFLLDTPVGLSCVASGLLLDGIGALWMARLTRVMP